MTGTLLRLHPLAASPTRWLLVSTGMLLTATLLTGAMVAIRDEPGRTVVREWTAICSMALAWCTAGFQLLLPAARRRAGRYPMTLPLSGRRLWATSLLCSFLSAGGTAALMVCALEGGLRLVSRWAGPLPFEPGWLMTAGLAQLLAAAALSGVLLHLPAPGREVAPVRGWGWAYAGAAVVMPGVLAILFRGSPWLFSGACLAGAAVLLLWGWQRVPEALLLAPESGHEEGAAGGWMPEWMWLSAVRWTFGIPTLLSAAATAMAFGVLHAILNRAYSEEDETGLLIAPVLVYMMAIWLATHGRNLHRLEALPFPRRKLAAILTFPVLGAAMAGYGVGAGIMAFRDSGPLVEFQQEAGRRFPLQKSKQPILRIPAQVFEIAWDGKPPELRAPWGEVHKPWQAPIWKGLTPVLYSPVGSGEAVSPEFAAWEIARAEGLVSHLPLSWAVPPLTVGICGASYLLIAGLLFGLRRADRAAWKRGAAAAVVMIGLMILYLIRVPLSMSGMTRGWLLGGAVSSLARSAVEGIPGGALTLWVLCAGALWASFEYAARRLERAEILTESPRRWGF